MNSELRSELLNLLRERISRRQILENVPLSRYTTLKLGGPADILIEVGSVEQIRHAFAAAADKDVPITVIGRGSNLLVRDGGLRGICLHMGDDFSEISTPQPLPGGRIQVTVQSGASLQKLCNAAADAGLSGLEFAAGIPGTVGGAVYMNAGAYGGQMSDCVSEVRLINYQGQEETLSNEEMHFDYRYSVLMERDDFPIVTEITFVLSPRDSDTVYTAMREFNNKRREKQPVHLPSCGSTFKRPSGYFAGTLIEECGLKGYRVGGCSVSTQHAGFLVNDQNGTAEDYEILMRQVRDTVKQKTGVLLEPEVRVIGDERALQDQ